MNSDSEEVPTPSETALLDALSSVFGPAQSPAELALLERVGALPAYVHAGARRAKDIRLSQGFSATVTTRVAEDRGQTASKKTANRAQSIALPVAALVVAAVGVIVSTSTAAYLSPSSLAISAISALVVTLGAAGVFAYSVDRHVESDLKRSLQRAQSLVDEWESGADSERMDNEDD